jgi:hypothetical protein
MNTDKSIDEDERREAKSFNAEGAESQSEAPKEKSEERSFASLRMTRRCLNLPRRLGDGLGDGFFPAALGF